MTRADAVSRVAQDLDRGLDWEEAINDLANRAGYDFSDDDDLRDAEVVGIVHDAERRLGWA